MPNQYDDESRRTGENASFSSLDRKTGLIRNQTGVHPIAAISLSGFPVKIVGFADVEGKSPCLWIVNERTGEIDLESARFFRVIDTNLVPTQTVLQYMGSGGDTGGKYAPRGLQAASA